MNMIYHYTDSNGLLGILENKSLRATEIKYLNDFEECKAGLNRLDESIKKIDFDKLAYPNLKELYENLHQFTDETLNIRKTFITSFTSKKDNLRQWMSYGNPNSSYAIGFDVEKLSCMKLSKTTSPRADEFEYCMRSVDYGDNHTLDLLINESTIEQRLLNTPDRIELELARAIVEIIFRCCSIKNHEFSDESETRFIFQTTNDKQSKDSIKFRERSGLLIPYIEVPIPINSIKEIIIGPNVNMDMAFQSIQTYIEHHEIECELIKSTCTLRQI